MKIIEFLKNKFKKEEVKVEVNENNTLEATLTRIINTKPKCLEKKETYVAVKPVAPKTINNFDELSNIVVKEIMDVQELTLIIAKCNMFDSTNDEELKKVYQLKTQAIQSLEKKLLFKLKQYLCDISYLKESIDSYDNDNLEFRIEYLNCIKDDLKAILLNFNYDYTIRDEYRNLYKKCNVIIQHLNFQLNKNIIEEEKVKLYG